MRYLFYILLLISFIQCKCGNEQSNGLLSHSDVQNIKKEFSEEAIRYFYETALCSDMYFETPKRDSNLYVVKWSEVLIKLSGDVKKEDSIIAKRVIDSLNILELPVEIKITSPYSTLYNLEIFFLPITEFPKVKRKGYSLPPSYGSACGTLYFTKSTIDVGLIGIPSTSDSEDKELTLLHEMVNILGLSFDPTSHPQSILYNGLKFPAQLSELDKETLRLLYSPYIKHGLTRSEFKKKLGEYACPDNILSKKDYINLENYVKNKKESEACIRLFLDGAFISQTSYIYEAHILKIPSNAYVKLPENMYFDSVFFTLTNKLTLEHKVSPATKNMGYNVLIEFSSNKKDHLERILEIRGPLRYYQLQKSTGQIYKDTTLLGGKIKQRVLLQSLIFALGIDTKIKNSKHVQHSILFNDKYEELDISQTDKELLELFFSPYIKNGMTKKRIKAIFEKYYGKL